MSHRHYIMATAGHVDHGKSSLVQALTGTDPDRLPEEKARGITIDLGFAHLELGGTSESGADTTYAVGIVDVPGHEDFVTNMVAGVGSVDVALLVVAADDGWMPQTEEHLQILTYLGVRHAVVALTKSDLLPGDADASIAEIRQRLADTPFANAPVVAVSASTGRGLDALRGQLTQVLRSMPSPPDQGKPRLTVDRVFSLQGIGTVVTGTLSGGTFRKGQPAMVQPAALPTRIRVVQHHHREVEESGPGTRTALNLADVSVAGRAAADAKAVQRGDVITLPGAGEASEVLDVWLEKSARLKDREEPAARALQDGSRGQFHLGSGHWPARLRLLDRRKLAPGEQALAQVRLEAPCFAFTGDRFILRDWTERWTLAGGVILNAVSERAQVRSAPHLAMLRQRAERGLEPASLIRSQLGCDRAVLEKGWLMQARVGEVELAGALAAMVADGSVIRMDGWLADAAWLSTVMKRAALLIEEAHRKHPERPGLDLAELKRDLLPRLPDEGFLPAFLNHLLQQGYTREGTHVRKTDHRPALPPALQAAGEKLRAALLVQPFEPPSRKELLNLPQGGEVLRFLLESGEAVDLGADTIMASAALTRAARMIRRHLEGTGGASVSDLRQLLKTNRRVIIPLLERLDRDRVTLRQGDKRVAGPG